MLASRSDDHTLVRVHTSLPTHRRASSAPAETDDATSAAREIARRVRSFRAYRQEVALGSWRADPKLVWRVRSGPACLSALAKTRVPALPLLRPLETPVPTPVVVAGPVNGVSFRPIQADRQLELSCELAARLPALADLLKRHGVRTAHVNSSYRDQPRVSFHTFGMALDIAAFSTQTGTLSVATDFEVSPSSETCAASATTPRGRALLAIACALGESGLFSSVLTPNYNEGHRDHFHLDVRPNDDRGFVR